MGLVCPQFAFISDEFKIGLLYQFNVLLLNSIIMLQKQCPTSVLWCM